MQAPPENADSFAIYVQAGVQADLTEATGPQNERARAVLASAFYFRLFDLAVNVGLLLWQQLSFRTGWGDGCYDIRVWATVWLASSVTRSMLRCSIYGFHMCTGRPSWGGCSLVQFLLEMFSFVWYLYGIHPLFVENKNDFCHDTPLKAWALFGWIFQSVVFFFPCALFVCCVPCFLCLTRFQWVRRRLLPLLLGPVEPSTNQTPIPEAILVRLKPTTFRAAVDSDAIDLEPLSDGPIPSPGGASEDNVTRSIINTTLGVGGFGHAMSSLMTRLNSVAATEDAPGGGGGGPPRSNTGTPSKSPTVETELPSRDARREPQQRGTMTCPICVTEFVPDDEILQLPCDPRRHVFHFSCVQEWLKKSQHCPMCRQNLVDLFERQENNGTADGR